THIRRMMGSQSTHRLRPLPAYSETAAIRTFPSQIPNSSPSRFPTFAPAFAPSAWRPLFAQPGIARPASPSPLEFAPPPVEDGDIHPESGSSSVPVWAPDSSSATPPASLKISVRPSRRCLAYTVAIECEPD